MNRVFSWYKEECAKLKGMSLRSKLSYVSMYYWVQISLILFVLIFGMYLYRQMSVQLYENHIAICFGNTMENLDEESDFGKRFAQYAGYDLEEKNLVIMDECWCKPGEMSAFNQTYYNLLVTYLDSGTLDALIMPQEDIAAIGKSGRLLDLRNQKTKQLFERYHDQLVWVMPNESSDYSNEPVPVGIDLEGTLLVGEQGAYADGAVLGVNALAQHTDQIPVLLDFLFDEVAYE